MKGIQAETRTPLFSLAHIGRTEQHHDDCRSNHDEDYWEQPDYAGIVSRRGNGGDGIVNTWNQRDTYVHADNCENKTSYSVYLVTDPPIIFHFRYLLLITYEAIWNESQSIYLFIF